MSEGPSIVALVRPMVRQMGTLSPEGRITLLCGLLAQEICCRPASERMPLLVEILDEIPSIFRATEEGMREALAQNAKDGT